MSDKAKLLLISATEASSGANVALLESFDFSVDCVDASADGFCEKLQDLKLDSYGVVLHEPGDGEREAEAVLASVRRKDRDLPVLLIVDQDAVSGGLAPDALLVRPFEPIELSVLVKSLLCYRGMRRAAAENETWLQLAQDVGGLAVLEIGLVARRMRWSPKFAELFSLPPDATGEDISKRVDPEDLPSLVADYRAYLQSNEPFERDFRVSRPDGTKRWVAVRAKLVEDAGGRAARALFLCADITERKEAELQNAQLAAIVSSSIDAIVSVDFDDRVLTWNRGAEQLFGYTVEEALGADVTAFVPAEFIEERAQTMARLAKGEAIEYRTSRRRKDGQILKVWIRGAPMRDGNGVLVGGSLIIRDITAQHQHEEHVRFLMRELTHRSKNLLAVIQAMARQTLLHLTTPEDFVARFSERLSGLAGSHDLLSSDDWSGASLVKLIRSQLQHYGDLFEQRIFLRGPDLVLRPEAAQNIGIALHELSTNAAKFGALSVPDGSITVSWTFVTGEQGERRLNLAWEELGGPPVAMPEHKGFGLMVMDRITGAALGGTSSMDFAPDGVNWRLDVPAAGVIRHSDGAAT